MGTLPSSEAVQSALAKRPGGWGKVVVATALRALLIAPGMAVAGARGTKLATGALLSSATITAFLFIFYRSQTSSDAVGIGRP